MNLAKKIYRQIFYYYDAFKMFFKRFYRKKHKNKDIIKFKNLYSGKRCFIVCTGPSLTFSDLDLLKNELTFSMNSIVNSFAKTNYRPNFYISQDPFVYENIYSDLLKYENDIDEIFLASCVKSFCKFKKKPKKTKYFDLDLDNHSYNSKGKIRLKFSEDCSEKIEDGFTVTYSAIQLAKYMGFKEIYLIGCDCNYKGSVKHFYSEYNKDESFHNVNAGDKMIIAYDYIKEYLKDSDIKIYNCTRGGMLEAFPRKKLEDVLSEEKN